MSDWDQRKDKSLSVDALVGKIMAMGNQIPQPTVIAMNPPPIDGMGTSSGFTMQLENRGSHTTAELSATAQKFIAAAATSGNRFGLHGLRCRYAGLSARHRPR